MVKPIYILSESDYETLMNIFNEIHELSSELPESHAASSITNKAVVGLFVLGKDTAE